MEPKDFAQVLLRRKRTVITAVIIAVVSVFFASMRKDPVYVAQCDVLFQAAEVDITNPNARPPETVGSIESNQALFTTNEIVFPVAQRLKLPPTDVFNTLNVEVIPGTQIFRLRAVDAGNPHPVADEKPEWIQNPGQRAGDLCNAFATEYVNFKRREAKDVFESQLAGKEASLETRLKEYGKIQRQLDAAEARGDRSEAFSLEIRRDTMLLRISDLQGEITGLSEQLEDGITGGGKIIAPAGEGQMQGVDHKRNLFMGTLVGLLFGMGIALVREYLDDTVKDKESAQRELGIPVLAALPNADDLDGLEEPSTGTIEAARNLRGALSSLGFPHEKSMLVVTSSLAKRRATTLASLAAAVAESGRSVLVIGADLRAGRTHDAFGIHNAVGLANVVRGQVPFEKAIRPAPGLEGVYVMPCGPIIGNPGELLSSESMAVALRRARKWADVVLLDAPPVLAAADSSILSAYADGVLLVVSAGQTNRAQANEAKEQLIAAGGRVLGAVLAGAAEPQRDDADPLGYGSFGDWGGGGFDSGAFDAGFGDGAYYDMPSDDRWYDSEVVNISAYTEARPARRRSEPPKKVSASRPGQRPARTREPAMPKGGVRTGSKSRATNGRAGTAKRSTTARKPTRKPTRAAGSAKTAAKKSSARTGAAKRATARAKPRSGKATTAGRTTAARRRR